jgi:hypothetical protein
MDVKITQDRRDPTKLTLEMSGFTATGTLDVRTGAFAVQGSINQGPCAPCNFVATGNFLCQSPYALVGVATITGFLAPNNCTYSYDFAGLRQRSVGLNLSEPADILPSVCLPQLDSAYQRIAWKDSGPP